MARAFTMSSPQPLPLPQTAATPAKNDNETQVSTSTGLPHLSEASRTTDLSDTARHLDCQPPPLLVRPSLRPSNSNSKGKGERALPNARRTSSSRRGVLRRSLIDDNDDELVDPFATRDGRTRASPGDRGEAPADSAGWGVREEDVPPLPSTSFYPLEKSSVFVPRAAATVVAARVEAVIRARPITASYDARNAKVDCVSSSGVVFRLRLYRGRGEVGEDGIIVEVQRREGFDLGHNQDVHAILDSAVRKGLDGDSRGEEGKPVNAEIEKNNCCDCEDEGEHNLRKLQGIDFD